MTAKPKFSPAKSEDISPDEVPSVNYEASLPEATGVASELAAMKEELARLKALAGETDRKVSATYDVTDDRIFLAKPNGDSWEERRIIDKKVVSIAVQGTAFFGPFDSEEQAQAYLERKKAQREDAWVTWEGTYALTGRAARQLREKEKAEREEQFGGSQHVNVLDRKLFTPSGSPQGIGTLVGPG